MNAIGETGLCLGVLAAAAAILASLVSVRFQSARALLAAKWAMAAVALMLAVASAALVAALLNSDFSLDYVAKFTERALPSGYKLAAFWAGQEGSLLLWALLLAVMSAIAAFTLNRVQSFGQSAGVIITLATVCGFFGLLLLFAADPFAAAQTVAADGTGLNPMLQDSSMIAHPPMLFLGYAGFTIPFALMVGALAAGRRDDHWIGAARKWSLAAWLFLTVGILLGAKWAYAVLGWGGYWGWDPVENASLLPWLTGTAFLHSIMVQQHRGMFRIWNVGMLAATFILCIFGTYLTRSGLVDSVHGFGQSLVGDFFLAFLVVILLFCTGLIIWRFKTLRPDHKLEGLLGREGAFLAANMLLTGITLAVLIGTTFPAITGGLTGTRTVLGAAFYNKVFGPVAMFLVSLMATGPLQVYGKEAARRLRNGIVVPAIAALIAAGGVWLAGVHNVWAIASGAIAAAAVTAIVIDLARSVILHSRHENPLLALVRLLTANHRRYGAQLAHLGIVMVLIGVVGSSVFNSKQNVTLNPGSSADFNGTRVTLDSINQSQGPNYTVVEATVSAVDSVGRLTLLHPQKRIYDKWEDQPNSVVAIESTWKRDLYVNLAGWDTDGKNVAMELISNPLVSWLWIGGWTVAIGGLICLTPRFGVLFIRHTRETPMKAVKPSLATSVATVACLFALFAACVPSTARAQATPALPPGHPDLSQIPAGDMGALPPGHPGVGPGATTQPMALGSVKIRAIQTTPGGPAIGADPVAVELYARGQLLDQTKAVLEPDGSLNVSGLPVRFGIQAVAKVTHGGIVFSAVSEAIDPEHPAQKVDVPVFEATTQAPDWSVTMRHVIVHPTAAGLEVTEMLEITTPGDHAWSGSADKTTFSLPLSAGVTDLKVSGGLDQAAVQVVNGKLVSHQALVPGDERYQLQYTVPAKNGQAVLSAVAPAKVGHVLVFIDDDGTAVTTQGLQAMGSQQMDEKGTKVRYYMATSLAAGQAVTLTVTGLKAAAAPEILPRSGAADEPAGEPVLAGQGHLNIPKAVAAFGATGMLFVGVMVMMARKSVSPAMEKVKPANRGRGHAGR